MKKISSELENSIKSLIEKGHSSRKIASLCNVTHSTVRLVGQRSGIGPTQGQKGRRKLLSNRDARLMERHLNEKTTTRRIKTPLEAAKAINKTVSEWTARRALKRIGFVSSVKQKKTALSDKNVKARLKFAKEHKTWSVEDWKRIIWSDETKINRFQSDGKEYYWHRPGDKLQKHQVKETVKHGGGSLMVWGCFTWWNIGPLVKISGIMNKEMYLAILKENLPDFIDECAYPVDEIVFQQDGDPKHTAKIVQKWLSEQKFTMLKWPAQSPDLNPIENLWAILKRRLRDYDEPPKNINELWDRISAEWIKIPSSTIEHLVESMPRRVASVIANKGLWTKY